MALYREDGPAAPPPLWPRPTLRPRLPHLLEGSGVDLAHACSLHTPTATAGLPCAPCPRSAVSTCGAPQNPPGRVLAGSWPGWATKGGRGDHPKCLGRGGSGSTGAGPLYLPHFVWPCVFCSPSVRSWLSPGASGWGLLVARGRTLGPWMKGTAPPSQPSSALELRGPRCPLLVGNELCWRCRREQGTISALGSWLEAASPPGPSTP